MKFASSRIGRSISPPLLPSLKRFRTTSALTFQSSSRAPKSGKAIPISCCAPLQRNGVMLMATAAEQTVGFVCVWIDEEDDMLLRNEQRQHALVSDIFVSEAWRRRGVARTLLRAAESEMRKRGCRRIRIRSKAANVAALGCYEAAGYRPYEVTFWKPIPASD